MTPPAEQKPAPRGTPLADLIGIIVGSQFVTTIIALLQGLVLVRLMAKAEYGSYAFVMALAGTFRDLGVFAVPDSILYFAPKVDRGQLRGLVRQSTVMLTGLGLIVGLLLSALSLAPHLFLEGKSGLSTMLLLAGATAAIALPASLFGNVFVATRNHRSSAGISMITTVLGAVFTLYPAWRGWPVEFIVAFQAVNTAIRFLLSEWLYRKLFAGVPQAPFPGGFRAQLAYVVPLAITKFAGIFNQRLDKFVVGIFFAASAFADFERGSQELPLVTLLPYTMASMMLPDLVGLVEKGANRTEGARAALELWKAGIRKASLVMLPIAAVLLVLAEPLMVTLYGQQYLPAAAPFRVYSSLLPLRVTSYGIMLMAYGQTTSILRVQLFGMAFNVAASFVLLPRIGMIGAPLAAVLTQVFMIIYILRRIDTVARVGLRGIFPWGHYGRVGLASIVGVTPALLAVLLHVRVHAAVLLAVGIPLTFAIYLPLARALGTLTAEDREYVARWLRLEPLRKKKEEKPLEKDDEPPEPPPSTPEL